MPRYFFDIHDHVVLRDDVGTELPDEQAARSEALLKARRCMLQQASFSLASEFHVSVRDADGTIIHSISFGCALELGD